MNGGYIMIDISAINMASSSTQSIPGLYAVLDAAFNTGKEIRLHNASNGASPIPCTVVKTNTGTYILSFEMSEIRVTSGSNVTVSTYTAPTPELSDIFHVISTPSTLYHGEGYVTLTEADGKAIVDWATKEAGAKPIIIKDDIQVYGGTKCNNIMFPCVRRNSDGTGYDLLTPTLTFTYITGNRRLSFVDSRASS